jgi:hypothetical protein
MRRISLLSLLLLALSASAASNASADPAFYSGISSDGEVAVFSTVEKMTAGDTDLEADVYVRAFDATLGELITRQVSLGLQGGNDTRSSRYDGMSADGTKVFFSTKEALEEDDTDSEDDVYMRDLVAKETLLVSQGDASCTAVNCGNGAAPSGFAQPGVAADGDVVFFTTTEALNTLDTDGAQDIYARRIGAEETMLVSAGDPSCVDGDCGDGPEAASFKGIDREGDRVVFTTAESLSSADSDSKVDIYLHDVIAGKTTLISVSAPCPMAPCTPSFGGISADGSHVFFETSEQLSGDDGDSSQDVYDWSGTGTPELISVGPAGGDGTKNARYLKSSSDGRAVYFITDESLVSTDTDGAEDVYRNREGVTTLISAGEGKLGDDPVPASLDWVSPESSVDRAVFSTSEPLVAGDADGSRDVYERSGALTTLISTGSEGTGGEFNASFSAASADGSKVFFVTSEKLVPQDTDNSSDIYQRSAAGTVRVSIGQINGNKELAAVLQGVSSDGSEGYFTTQERLTEGDNDSEQDVYVWSEVEPPLLVSRGNGTSIGPSPPTLEGTTPISPDASTTPSVFGSAALGSQIKIFKSTGCTGPVVAQGTAAQLASPGFALSVSAGATTFLSAIAEYEGLLSECSNSLSYRQEDAPPPPPPAAEEGGSSQPGSSPSGSGGSAGAPSAAGKTGSGGGFAGNVKGGTTYVTPLPRITFGPASKTRLRRPTFRFLDSTEQPATRFFCRVDKRRWAGCTSPIKVRKLKPGRHVFSLKAVNAVGVASTSPVKRAFKVVAR